MAIPIKEKGSGNALSFAWTILFFVLIIAAVHLFYVGDSGIKRLGDIEPWEFFLLTLAVFRLIRLMTYDSVAQFIRDIFLDKKEEKKNGLIYIHRKKPKNGFRRLMADLIYCPWCVGVWIALFSVFTYLYFPFTWFFWLILAIAGASTAIQLIMNFIGWSAEHRKLKTQDFEKKH